MKAALEQLIGDYEVQGHYQYIYDGSQGAYVRSPEQVANDGFAAIDVPWLTAAICLIVFTMQFMRMVGRVFTK